MSHYLLEEMRQDAALKDRQFIMVVSWVPGRILRFFGMKTKTKKFVMDQTGTCVHSYPDFRFLSAYESKPFLQLRDKALYHARSKLAGRSVDFS